MPAGNTKFQKNRYFFYVLISLVLLIVWNSRVILPPKKVGIDGEEKKEGMDMGGLGGGHKVENPTEPKEPSTPEPPHMLAPPIPPPRPAWMDEPGHGDVPPAPAPPAYPPPAQQPAAAPAPEAAFQTPNPASANARANANWDYQKLATYKPHNYKGPNYPTFATYLSTREGSVRDPYFLAAQQLVYRVLWDPRSKSFTHPMTVFVAPHIPQQQRDILSAAGANVVELGYVEGLVAESEATKWKDLFSKLNMWGQTEFSRIAYLDVDAFPIKNVDGLFDLAQERQCQRELLPQEEQVNAGHLCNFVFTATDISGNKEVDPGVMVLQPNAAMHQYLLRESKKLDQFDASTADQPFISYAFRQNGPHPTEFIDRIWNGVRPQQSELSTLHVMHARLWEIAPGANGALSWAAEMFDQNWSDMLDLYQSQNFESMRAADGPRATR